MQDDAGYLIELGRVDWWVSKAWNRLHAVRDDAWTDDQREDMADGVLVGGPVRLACGRTAAWVSIPGLFTRSGAARCTGCCRATGLPQGQGSPKNDDACRLILGLTA